MPNKRGNRNGNGKQKGKYNNGNGNGNGNGKDKNRRFKNSKKKDKKGKWTPGSNKFSALSITNQPYNHINGTPVYCRTINDKKYKWCTPCNRWSTTHNTATHKGKKNKDKTEGNSKATVGLSLSNNAWGQFTELLPRSRTSQLHSLTKRRNPSTRGARSTRGALPSTQQTSSTIITRSKFPFCPSSSSCLWP